MGCWGARAERVSSSVTNWPVFVFLGFFTSSSSPNRKSPSCLGEFRFRGWPAASSIFSRRPSIMAPTLTEASSRDSGSTRMPVNSMSASTGRRGSSTVRNSSSMPLSFTCFFRMAESWRVMSASSAEYLPMTSTGMPAGIQLALPGSRRGNVLQLDGGILQQVLRQKVHAVLHAGGDQGVRQQRVKKGAFNPYAVGAQNFQIKLQMVPGLLRRAFQKRPDRFQVRRTGDRHVPCLVRFRARRRRPAACP